MMQYWLLLSTIVFLAAAVLYTTLTEIDPTGDQAMVAYTTFFIAVFAGVWALVVLVHMGAVRLWEGRAITGKGFRTAVRRGFLIALYLCILCVLQLYRVLGVLELSITTLLFLALEYTYAAPTLPPTPADPPADDA
ncbi:hypothetical protein H6771_03225 [Candidatus Peribacteria bacterium]|nr:hypothetical protein [Candidatus Peribacteria bacterium]